VPKIEVTFDIDSNGILSVAARDTASGKSQSINITASSRLSESEKKRMVEDAERYADADRKRRDDAEKLNAADATCYEAEKLLANFAAKLTDDLKKRIETGMRETKEAMGRKDVALATERGEALRKTLKEAGATLYTQSGQAQKGGPYTETRWQGPTPQPDVGTSARQASPGGADAHAKVVDAEYRESK
jgi:molecular chaperone DnaK